MPKGGERGSRICSSVSLVATPRPPQGADRFMLTTILAYVVAAVGLATILAGGWSFVMLAIQNSRGVLENLAEALRDRRGASGSEFLSKRSQLVDLFGVHRGLLFGVCRPQFGKIGR